MDKKLNQELNEEALNDISGGTGKFSEPRRIYRKGICPKCGSETEGYVDAIDDNVIEQIPLRCPICDPPLKTASAFETPLASIFKNA